MICNFRPLCFLALFTGIIVVGCMLSVWLAVASVGALSLVLIFVKTPIWFRISASVLMATVCGSYIVTTAIYSNAKEFDGGFDLTGVVESYNDRSVVLRDIEFNGRDIYGNVRAWLREGTETEFAVTQKITIKNVKLYRADATSININNKIRYTTNIYPNTEVVGVGFDNSLRAVVLRYTKWYLPRFLSDPNAELLYSMMFGDRNGLDDSIQNDFTAVGLSHVLAVSGMNVALLAFFIVFILRICGLGKRYRIFVLAPVLIFYTYLCGWQYSIMRASIMFLTFYYVKSFQGRADNLSVLSLAAIIILVIFPYSLLSASFLLSFACVFGIILYYSSFKKFVFNGGVAMYLSVTVATFPLLVLFFGCIPTYGILAAVVLLPLLSLSFNIGMFAIITVIGGAALYAAEPALSFVRWSSAAIAKLPGAQIQIAGSSHGIVFYFLGLIIFSRFMFLSKPIRWMTGVTAFACYFIILMV
jgi:ComEC/Rec2-related protein